MRLKLSYEAELQRIKDEIVQNLPSEIKVKNIEFEGPEIAVYSENSDVEAIEDSNVLKDLAKVMRKNLEYYKYEMGKSLNAHPDYPPL